MAFQRCWACGWAIPHVQPSDGCPPPSQFECGWCAAWNYPAAASVDDTPSDPPVVPRLLLAQVAGRTLVVLVLALVGSVFVVGVTLVLPALVGPLALVALHLPLAVLLAFNILFNYVASVAQGGPGGVQRHLQQTAVDGDDDDCSGVGGGVPPTSQAQQQQRVVRGSLRGYTWCQPCAFYKPPAAHHCRSCGCCVMELDHHCWYINNCVGAANLRHFLLFLVYVVAGAGYALALGAAMGWRDWGAIWHHTMRVLQATRHLHPVLRVLSFTMRWVLSAPAYIACWAYYTTVCLATVVSVGLLLCRQLRLLVAGSTYLARLAAAQHQQYGGPPPPPPRLDMRNVRRVLGSNALTWLLPAWGPPLVGTKAS